MTLETTKTYPVFDNAELNIRFWRWWWRSVL